MRSSTRATAPTSSWATWTACRSVPWRSPVSRSAGAARAPRWCSSVRHAHRGPGVAAVPVVLPPAPGPAEGAVLISFRYHVVTIVAVFLALGLGVLAGTTVLDQGLVKNLKARTDAAEQQ